ncbi:MAG TPA: PilN domain-containing protein [Gemmatimonadaceae bacterium]|jgi:Tfp pilus assembly protein PilN
MIEINLLPGARRTKSSARQPIEFKAFAAGVSTNFRDRYLVVTAALTAVAVIAFAGLYLTQTSKASTLVEHQEKAIADSTRYANFLKERSRSEAVRDTLLRQVNIIRGLDEDRYIWPHVMDEISRVLPQYTWLLSVSSVGTPQGTSNVVAAPKNAASEDTSAAAKRRKAKRLDTEIPKDTVKVQIRGRTVDIQAFTRFMSDLEASPFFSGVQIDKVENATDQGKEVTEFQLTVGYTRPDTLLLHRVPLALSTTATPGGR